jgi:hypothetical protein
MTRAEILRWTPTRTQPKKAWNLVKLVKEIEPRCLLFVNSVHSLHPARISGPEKARFLQMLQEHHAWLATLSLPKDVGAAGLAKPTYMSPTSITSTTVSSGFRTTGKTCPPNQGLNPLAIRRRWVHLT